MAEQIEAVDGQSKKSLYLVYLTNLTTQRRIWNALCMRQNLSIIEKVLTKNDLGKENCEFCSLKCNSEIKEKFGSTLLSKLNESQLEAVLSTLAKIECTHKSSVQLIWGPPGTGKTATISRLLYILLTQKVRTIICAPTNVAITELASRVIELVRNSGKTDFLKKKKKSFLPCCLGDMLIYGNKDHLKVGSDIEGIFLDDRVESLGHCLTGWKHCVASMLEFLENCISHYRIKGKESLHDEINKNSEPKSLLEFARDRFSCLARPLKRCMLAFSTHLPSSYVSDSSFSGLAQLMALLNSFESLLFEDISMTYQKLEGIFLQKATIASESFVDTSSLLDIRSKCLEALRDLRVYLDKLGLPAGTNRSSTEYFCFQRASLVFCTISSSYKLHSVDMKPFNVLVIDEAAQVKECESIIALQIPGVRNAVLVGDEKQLSATVRSKLCEEAGFGRSLFERLSSLGHSKHLLNVQYRMHPLISRFPNSNFYLNQILDADCVQSERYERRYLQGRMFGPYSFINVRGGKEEPDDIGHSRKNMVEVAVIMKLVQNLFKAWNGKNEKLSIGVISPYAAQVAIIQYKLEQNFKNNEGFIVNVKSVDGFQGGEEDIVIMSTVRSHNGGSIGFLASPRRINVALTRARHSLWILGNERTLSRSDSIWEALIRDAKHRKCFFTADEDCEIRETIIKVKSELGQLDDLFSGESLLFKNSIWKVSFSDNFRKSFQTMIASNIRKPVVSLLLKLASGWRPKKVNVDWKCTRSSYVVKQFKVDRYFIVCSIDIIKESMYVQALKVWDILPIVETPGLLKRLDNIFAMYTEEFVNHCNEKLFERNLELPKSWPVCNEIIRFKEFNSTGTSAASVDSQSYVENSKVSESLLLMKFYSLSSGAVNHLLTDVEGRELDLPFEITDEERDIIMFPRSSFILGRSGTGKTTILTMKLFQKFQHYFIASRESLAADNSSGENLRTALHQIFVTVSPKLCYAVKKHVSQLTRFACENVFSKNNMDDMDDIDVLAEFKDIPDTFDGVPPENYPLIITFQKFLMMLDGSLGNSYFKRFPDVRGSSTVALQGFVRKNEVTYDRFRNLYWPHFNAKLTKNLDPSRVFTEIMSHIKGDACNSKQSRQDYVALSDQRVSMVSAENRDVIYSIFEDYEKMKLGRGEFDLADFVNDIHLRLKNENILGDKLDFVYVDEVQDLTMRQISLFKYICKNVEGFVFSGDTAQTIARGIDFRFEDIRSLFYKEFFMKSQGHEFQGRTEKGLISDIFCLSQNFRTHTGVLMLAQSVIDIICHFFPHSIDLLSPETSLIHGESPVVLEPGFDDNQILTIFGNRENAGGKWVGFGADQVILVRDDSIREEISKYIGHKALVLTILECKGLEFEDVLLYNFFGSSPLSNQWRVVYDFLKEKHLLDVNSPKTFPSFSESKHSILCSELKQLYVAITRTRQRLWIYENNQELSKPMLDYWKRLCLVQVRKIDDSIAKEMQRTSSTEEWKTQGIKLFWEKNYEMAIMCFQKAGDGAWEKRAKASGLRASADALRGSNPEKARVRLREAAEIFVSIGRTESAAECFCDLGEYERAGRIYLEKCGMSELRKAGECFSLAGLHETAAGVYAKGHFFKECLSACSEGNNLDLSLHYIESWRQDTEIMKKFNEIDKIAQEFLEKCALECFRTNNKTSLTKFVRAFRTMESKRHFLKSLDCLDVLLNLEEESGNFHEAIEIAKSIGDIPREADLLEKVHHFEKASSLLLSYVLSKSLWVSGSQGWPLKSFPQKDELLTKAMLVSKVSIAFHASICTEAESLSHEEKSLSELVQCYKASKQHKSRTGEIILVRKLLDAHFEAIPENYKWDPSFHIDPRFFDERMSKNQVSCGTLLHVWNSWKVHVLEILTCLKSLETVDFVRCDKGTLRFCFEYFGVRLPKNLSVRCKLMNPDAAWLIDVDENAIMPCGNISTLEARHFLSAAWEYWRKELVSVALKVLESLRKLYQYSVEKSLSQYCQSLCLTCIFDISRFFLESKSLCKNNYVRKMHDFLQLSTKNFEIVFPLDSGQSSSKNMISLRETDCFKNLLEEIIHGNINGMNKLTYGQIGRVTMVMLGSSLPKCSLYERVSERFYERSSWNLFIGSLCEFTNLNNGGIVSEALGHDLYQALSETYNNARWRAEKDYISPNCFFYLVERLLILVPHSRGISFATKSSFIEYLIGLPSDASPSAGLITYMKSNPKIIDDFVVNTIRECLLNSRDTADWINNSRIDCDYYFPVLMTRMAMILCLSCLNSESSFNVIFELLAVPHIRSALPSQFCEAICCDRKSGGSYVGRVAEAFKAIGNPLVVVTSGANNPKFVCPDAIFLNLRSFSCKSHIMETLLSKSTEVSC